MDQEKPSPIIPEIKLGKLADALAKAQKEIKAPLKNRVVDFTDKQGRRIKYNYADLADVIDCIREPLSKNGLAITHQLGFEFEGFGLTTSLLHLSGEMLTSWYPLPDPVKQPIRAQEFGSALTYARRYSLSSLIGIASEEDDDGSAAAPTDPPNKPKSQPPKPNVPPKEEKKEPVTPPKQTGFVTEAQLKRLYAISNAKGWTNDQCKLYMTAAWSIESSKDLDREKYDTLIAVIEAGNYVSAIGKLKVVNMK